MGNIEFAWNRRKARSNLAKHGEEYDFSRSRKNPYAKQLKSQITIRLDTAAVAYFKQMAAELGMPYQNLINLFLRDCAQQKRRPSIQWREDASKQPVRR